MHKTLLLLPLLLLSGCATSTPRTLVEMSEKTTVTDKRGTVTIKETSLKASLEKELTADDLAVALNRKHGFSLAARHIETHNQGTIAANTQQVAAIGTAAGNVIEGAGRAAGSAGALIIGTQGATDALGGLTQIIGSKMTLDAAQAAAAARAASAPPKAP